MDGNVVVTAAQPARLYYAQTGFAVRRPRIFAAYFVARGGVRTFGYPLSRPFTLRGERVQLFQRFALRRGADGQVSTLDLPVPDFLPYPRLNGATVPVADAALIAAAPAPSQPDYATQALAFVQANAPDMVAGMPVGFGWAFSATVTCADAFPGAACDPGLLPALALEIWGLPTSRPTRDPANANVVYLRFERGVLAYDAATATTQGLLLGDLFRRLLSGHNLPSDLAAEAAHSPYQRQYAPSLPDALARPADLPDTDLTDAFTPLPA